MHHCTTTENGSQLLEQDSLLSFVCSFNNEKQLVDPSLVLLAHCLHSLENHHPLSSLSDLLKFIERSQFVVPQALYQRIQHQLLDVCHSIMFFFPSLNTILWWVPSFSSHLLDTLSPQPHPPSPPQTCLFCSTRTSKTIFNHSIKASLQTLWLYIHSMMRIQKLWFIWLSMYILIWVYSASRTVSCQFVSRPSVRSTIRPWRILCFQRSFYLIWETTINSPP